jgi:hypothetical protein
MLGAQTEIKLHACSNQIDAVAVRRRVVCEPQNEKTPENRRVPAGTIKEISAMERLVAFNFAGESAKRKK